jgi:glycosyltransferase involved in cell wall biosynthesis
MENNPLVSCLCVSFGRPENLKRAISYFNAQSYPNKELIIISKEYEQAYQDIITTGSQSEIKYYYCNHLNDLTLGDLRNMAINKASGEYVCIWDDDDWFHYERIKIQIDECIKNKKSGSVLPYYLLYDNLNREAYMSIMLTPPASVLCKRSLINESISYLRLNKGEDTSFVKDLNRENALFPLINPLLYIYVFHGANTWDHQHFKKLCSRKFSQSVSDMICGIANNKYDCKQGSFLLDSSSVLDEYDYFNSFEATKLYL